MVNIVVFFFSKGGHHVSKSSSAPHGQAAALCQHDASSNEKAGRHDGRACSEVKRPNRSQTSLMRSSQQKRPGLTIWPFLILLFLILDRRLSFVLNRNNSLVIEVKILICTHHAYSFSLCFSECI